MNLIVGGMGRVVGPYVSKVHSPADLDCENERNGTAFYVEFFNILSETATITIPNSSGNLIQVYVYQRILSKNRYRIKIFACGIVEI